MKRLSLLLATTILLVWSSNAQILGFGARVGIGTGTYDFHSVPITGGTLEPTGERVSGYQAALFMRLSIPRFIYLQPELQLSKRDYVVGIKYPSEPKMYKTVSAHRIEVPLLLGIKLGSVRLFGGPVWRIGSREQVMGGGDTSFDIIFDDNDVAAVGGVGVEFDGVFFELRYSSYMKKTTSEMVVAHKKHEVDILKDHLVQINFGLFF